MSVFNTIESKFTSLRMKLDNMGYLQPLGLESVLLVERLYADLSHATEGLNKYKEQNLALVEEKNHLNQQIEPFKVENAKLIKEVNELNLKLLNQNEKFEETIKDLKNTARKLEHENSDLRFLNTQYYHKLQALERESQQKSELIMNLQERHPQAVVLVSAGKKATLAFRRQKMEIDAPLHMGISSQILRKVQEQSQDVYIADLLRMADNRVEQLETEKKKLLDTMEETENALTDLQKQVASRDKEIRRLNKMLDGGRPIEAILTEAKLEANDNLVTSLHMQIECLQKENIELENKLSDLEGKVKSYPISSKEEENKQKLLSKRVPQKQESYNRPKSTGDTKPSENLIRRHAESEKRNKNLITLLKNKDEERIKLETIIKELEKDKEELERKLKQMTENEKDLIMEIDRLSRKKVDEISDIHSPEHLQQLVRILEAQRDHYREEVAALQNIQQYGIGNTDWHSGKTASTKVKVRVTDKSGKENKASEKIVHLLEEEKNYYKSHYLELEKQTQMKDKEVPNSAVLYVDKEISVIDDDFYRLREENKRLQDLVADRDELKRKVKDLESSLSQDASKQDEQLEKAREEKAKLETSIQKLQDQLEQERGEVMRLRSELVLSARSPQHTTLNLMLQRIDQEKNDATYELHQRGEEKRQLQMQLQEMEDNHEVEKKRLQQQIEDLRATIFDSEKNRKSLETELLFHKKKLSSIEEESENLRYQHMQLQEEHNQSTATVNQMKLIVDQEEQSSNKLHSQLMEKEEQLHFAKEKIHTLENKLEEVNNIIDHYNSNVASLEGIVEKMSRERTQFQNIAEEKSQHLLNVQKEMFSKEEQTSHLKIMLTTMEAQLDKLQADIRSKDQEIQSLKRQIDANSQQLESLNDTQEVLKRENKRLLEDLGTLTIENQALSKELEKVHSEQETMKRQIQEYVTEVARVEELLAVKEQQRTELLQQYRNLSEENVQLESQTHQLATRNSSTELEVVAKQEELNMCRHTISALQDEIEKHLANEYKYRQDVNTLNVSRSDLEAELQQTHDIMKNLQAELASARALCTQLDSSRDQLQRQKANDEAEKQQFSLQVHDLQEESKNLRSQITNERAKVLNLEGVLAATREKEFRNHLTNQELTAEVKLLRDRLQENEDRLEKQSKELAACQTKLAEMEMKTERLKRQVTNEKFEKERTSQELRRLRQQHQHYISETISRETTEFRPTTQILPTTFRQYEIYSSKISSLPSQLDATVQTSPQINITNQRETIEGQAECNTFSSAQASDIPPQTMLFTQAQKEKQPHNTGISSSPNSEEDGASSLSRLKESQT